MKIETRFQPGDIAYIGQQKFLVVLVVVDENQVYYCGGRNPKDDPMVPEKMLSPTKSVLFKPEK